GSVVALGTNFWGNGQIEPTGYELLRSFDISPVPKWTWGQDNWQLTRQLVMPYGLVGTEDWGLLTEDWGQGGISNVSSPMPNAHPQFCHRILIHYRYEGSHTAILRLRLLIAERDFH
ncbi:MAG: glycogen debranching enzyme N-terminal domain-containing protein, partial [Nostoc sp.]